MRSTRTVKATITKRHTAGPSAASKRKAVAIIERHGSASSRKKNHVPVRRRESDSVVEASGDRGLEPNSAESTHTSPISGPSTPRTPLRKSLKRSSSSSSSPVKQFRLDIKNHVADGTQDDSINGAVNEALSLHDALLQVLKSKFRCKGGSWNSGAVAVGVAAGEMYWDLLGVFNRLFQQAQLGTKSEVVMEGESKYSVYEIDGEKIEGRKGRKKLELSDMLDQLRSRGPTERATEALFTVLSCMGSRQQMCWVESFEDEKPNRGYFAHALVDPICTTRLSCVELGHRVVPASLIVTEKWSFRECLDNFDNDGPLKEAPKRLGSKCEFAFQALIDDDKLLDEDERICDVRTPLRDLAVDRVLTEFILKDAPVLLLDSYLALAPREVVAAEGLGKIIRAEFETVLRKAKQDGMPVILQLGGSEAHMLAKKVYMRPNFAQYGLRCGYIRWRMNSGANWGKEQHCDDRVCLGLQLP